MRTKLAILFSLVAFIQGCGHWSQTASRALPATKTPTWSNEFRNSRELDQSIQASISNFLALADPSLSEITARSKNGEVRLEGKIRSAFTHQRLLKAIGSLKGVRNVIDRTELVNNSSKGSYENQGWLSPTLDLLAMPLAIAALPFILMVIYVEMRLRRKRHSESRDQITGKKIDRYPQRDRAA